MKKYITTILLLITLNVFGQNLEECGIDDHLILTSSESEFLNKYMIDERSKNFDFSKKKIIFITGSRGREFGTKSKYFNDIKKWNKNGKKIATHIIELNEKEKIDSGGYDVIVTYWVKVLTKRSKRKIIKRSKRRIKKVKRKNEN